MRAMCAQRAEPRDTGSRDNAGDEDEEEEERGGSKRGKTSGKKR